MGLFGKKKEKKPRKRFIYEVTMTPSGKLKEDEAATVFTLEEEVEFLAVYEAEKKYPKLKVAKVVCTNG